MGFDKEYFLNQFPNSEHKRVSVKKYYAYDMIVSVLEHKYGNKAVWLPEYDQIVDWLHDSKGKGLLVIGDSGLGKSVICYEIIPKIINMECHSLINPKCLAISAYEMANYGDENDIYSSDFIMIDDVGVEGDFVKYGAHRNMFKEIVYNAERQGKILILTTNLTIEQLKEKYDERTTDRLRSLCRLVVIKGDSFRPGTEGRNGIPKRIRAYGIDFETQEEADAFSEEQCSIKFSIDYEGINVFYEDREEYNEGQPMKIVFNPKTQEKEAFALLKHDWRKYEEDKKKREEREESDISF